MSEMGVLEPHSFSGYSRTTVKQLIPCPLCMAPDSGVETSSENLQIVGLGLVSIGYGYCCTCGHIYQVRPAPKAMMAEYYEKFSNYVAPAKALTPTAMTLRLLSLANDYCPEAERVYEVGCGSGAHLFHFKAQGASVGGCEPSARACERAKDLYGLDIDEGAEAQCVPKQSNLDLIYFSGVLEHLHHPTGALKRAYAALADTGMVMLEVPCATSPESLPPGWFAFEHLHYFTLDSIKQMLAWAGFGLIEARISYRDFMYPVITAIAGKAQGHINPVDGDPTAARNFIDTYNKRDRELWARTAEKVSAAKRPIWIWGAGIHTSQLLDHIPGLEVEQIIDRDQQKWGQTLAGKMVHSPESYLRYQPECSLVISSYANENQIMCELAGIEDFLESRVIRLYT